MIAVLAIIKMRVMMMRLIMFLATAQRVILKVNQLWNGIMMMMLLTKVTKMIMAVLTLLLEVGRRLQGG